MAQDVYVKLREFLDGLPGGFPATDSGVELELLAKYFTPAEAELAMGLNRYPETAEAIAQRLGIDPAGTAEMLESMAKAGSIYRVRCLLYTSPSPRDGL